MGGRWPAVLGRRSSVVGRRSSVVRRRPAVVRQTEEPVARARRRCSLPLTASLRLTDQSTHRHTEKPALTSAFSSFLIDPICRIITMTTNNTMTVVEKTAAGREVRFCFKTAKQSDYCIPSRTGHGTARRGIRNAFVLNADWAAAIGRSRRSSRQAWLASPNDPHVPGSPTRRRPGGTHANSSVDGRVPCVVRAGARRGLVFPAVGWRRNPGRVDSSLSPAAHAITTTTTTITATVQGQGHDPG